MQHQLIYSQDPGQPVIQAARVTLRPLQRSDEGLWTLYAGDARVAKSTPSIPHPLPPGAVAAMIARANGPDRLEDTWALDGAAHGLGELVGAISLARMDGQPGQSEISYWVAPALWNTGLASEALRALLEANPHKAQTIFAQVFQSNDISARVLTNAGFEYLGDAEVFSVANGATVPTWTYLKRLPTS